MAYVIRCWHMSVPYLATSCWNKLVTSGTDFHHVIFCVAALNALNHALMWMLKALSNHSLFTWSKKGFMWLTYVWNDDDNIKLWWLLKGNRNYGNHENCLCRLIQYRQVQAEKSMLYHFRYSKEERRYISRRHVSLYARPERWVWTLNSPW